MTDHAAAVGSQAIPGIVGSRRPARAGIRIGWLVPTIYILFLMLPIYWLLNMSFKTTNEILGGFTLYPHNFTLESYREIFPMYPVLYNGYISSITYVFDQHAHLGRRGVACGLCVFPLSVRRRQAPLFLAPDEPHGPRPAVFALPFFQLYSAIGLFDTHIAVALAHCLFNIPLAVWILEGFMSGVPKEIDETAYIDGYSFPLLLREDLHAADRIGRRRRSVLLLHVLVG